MPSVLDTRPLTDPVDRAAAQRAARDVRAAVAAQRPTPVGRIVALAIAAFLVVPLLVIPLLVMVAISPRIALVAGIVLLVLIGIAVAIAVPLGVRARRAQEDRWFRLAAFARANALEYLPVVPAPALPGMVFGLGDDRQTRDALRGTQPRFVEFGNYSYTTTSSNGKTTQTTTHRWGYIAIRLDVPLPNIVLDAVGNNGLFGSNLPRVPAAVQRLGLEGDFDRYFALYCPQGYEADALYLFTPDVMARFIDNAALLDVEIVDDWLLLYRQGGFSMESPQTWQWVFGVVGSLLDRMTRWGRWRDDRLAAAPSPVPGAPALLAAPVPAEQDARLPFIAPTSAAGSPVPPIVARPPGVAPPGRRLRGRFPVGAIIALAIVLGVGVLGPIVALIVVIASV